MKHEFKEHLNYVSQLAETRFTDMKRQALEKYADVKLRRADLLDQAAQWIEHHDVHDLRYKGENLLREARNKVREFRSKLS